MTFNGHSPTISFFQTGKGIILLGIGLLWVNTACNRSDEIRQEYLYGRWEIYKAERNGRDTPYLRRGYFDFQKNGEMKVNITGEEEQGKFVMEGALIRFQAQGESAFAIKSLRQDSMEIQYDSGSQSQFKFYMVKAKEDVR
jgi:hypothetical protein